MNFTFPKDKVLQDGTLKNHSKIAQRDLIEPIDISKPTNNQIQINGTDYFFTYLNPNGQNKGGHSIVLKLFEAQSIDISQPNYDNPDLVIKINKHKKKPFLDKYQKRFTKEIQALIACKSKDFQNVISIHHSGECKIYNFRSNRYEDYLYYTMEYAPYDLKSFVETNHETISLDNKIDLCINLAKGVQELSSVGYYHRDIKPDNIFIDENDVWKIGDLGLIGDRDINFEIDFIAEQIGPRGWMSPESMNKYLTENKGFLNNFPCRIDHQSDIFQLGKVFWYIFQHNAPIGGIKQKDFLVKNTYIYSIIKTMLNHSRTKRYKDISEVIILFTKESEKLLKSKI